MKKKRPRKPNYTKTAFILFCLGTMLIIVSYLIQVIFINGTNFRQEFKERRYEQCVTINSQSSCSNELSGFTQ